MLSNVIKCYQMLSNVIKCLGKYFSATKFCWKVKL